MIYFQVALRKETDEGKKSELARKLIEETIPNGLVIYINKRRNSLNKYFQGQLEARLIERGGQFFVGNNLTWADLHLHFFVNIVQKNHAEV